jgi:tetratricopeptide (TPR) repeat protein
VVTVLAVDLVGSTRHIASCDPDDAQDFFDRCFERVRGAVERAGGLVVDYEGDGGVALFGWPNSLEDHADRACAASWDLQSAAPINGPSGQLAQFRVGLHSGLVSLRRVNRDGTPRLNMTGATVHIAAALQKSASPAGILLSSETLDLCRTQLNVSVAERPAAFADLGIDMFSLDANPTFASRPSLAQRYKSPIVGRAAELAAVRAELEGSSAHCTLAIIGEPGIGKSRIAAAAILDASGDYTRAYIFFGDAQKRTTPFAAARALILDALQASGSNDLGESLTEAGLSDEEVRTVQALVSTELGAKRGGRNLTQTQVTRALSNAFVALAIAAPTSLLIEDLHLLDAESRHFLRMIARAKTPHPLFMLVTGRPEALRDAQAMAKSVLELDPLPASDMEALAQQLWTSGDLPKSVVKRVLDRADGIPFVLEELVGALDPDQVDAFNPLPQSVASVIHARMNRLSAGAKATVQALSLLGEEVETEFAKAVLQDGAERFARNLDELERFSFIHPPLGRSVRFRHQIVTQACADTIPRKRRQRLHADAIKALTTISASLSGQYERLAFHAEGAGDDQLALNYLWESAIEARNASAAASLSLTLDHALELTGRIGAPAEEKFVDFVLMAFASMLQLGEFSKMNAVLPRTMELARIQDRPDKVCGSMSQMAMVCWFEGRYAEGLEIAESALKIARSLNSLPLIFSNQLMIANILHCMAEMDRAITTLTDLSELLSGELETARLGAAAIPSSTAHAFVSFVLIDTGRYEEAVDHGERALAIALREHDTYSEVLARHSLGRALVYAGRDGDAAACLTRALELSESSGYDAIKPDVIGSLSLALARVGRAVEAIGLAQACFDAGLHLRTGRRQMCFLFTGYAEALFEAGDHEASLSASERAVELARGLAHPCLLSDSLGLRAHLRARLDPSDTRVREDLDEQREICSRHGIVAWAARAVA